MEELQKENSELKQELERLRQQLGQKNDSSHDDDSPTFRIEPVIENDKVVGSYAIVSSEATKKKKKHKNKDKKKSGVKKKKKRPVVIAKLGAGVVLAPVTDIEEREVNKLKLKVMKLAKSHNVPVAVVSDESSIEQILEAELAKGKYTSFYLVNLGAIVEKYLQWKQCIPRVEPFYAMKSNPDVNIVRTLHFLETGMDCASKPEMEIALKVGVPPSKIIFANPCKPKEHILYAKEKGIEMMTFDSKDELAKILELFPTAKLVVRILPDDSHSAMPFGTKFGATFKETKELIGKCKQMGASLVGVSFHVGSGCYSSSAYVEAILLARRVFDAAEKEGYTLSLLDIGGGWPGTNDGPLSLEEIGEAIEPILEKHFPPSVRVISEPGRFFCTSCYTLAVTVVSRREKITPALPVKDEEEEEATDVKKEILYYLSDGVYGSFNNIVFDHATPTPIPMKKEKEGAAQKSSLFGPTCDSIDVICKDIDLPELEIGDWMYFINMGAYTVAAASSFNGFKPPNAFYMITLPTKKEGEKEGKEESSMDKKA